MEKNLMISVIIPCYNQGRFLRESVGSVFNQGYDPLEIMIVNDGSTEPETLDALEKIKQNSVKVIHKENGHLASARNYGIRHSSGELLLTLDADDKLHPDFIKKTLPVLLENEKIAAVSSWARHFGAKNTLKKLTGGGVKDFIFANQCTACALFRKTVWEETGGYDENLKGFTDWEFWIQVTKRGYQIYVLQEPLIFYRAKKESMITSSMKNRPEYLRYMVSKHADVFTRFLPDLVYQKESEILKIHGQYRNSFSYRLGKFLLWPFHRLKNTKG